jgi:hypothetical protein
MANIMDLLMDFKRTVKINDNISFLYIMYQVRRYSLYRMVMWAANGISSGYLMPSLYAIPVVASQQNFSSSTDEMATGLYGNTQW